MKTTDHNTIKEWAKNNGAIPVVVENDDTSTSILRFTFGDDSNESLQEVNWEHFFELFEQNDLALVLSDDDSSFNKFVSRSDDE